MSRLCILSISIIHSILKSQRIINNCAYFNIINLPK